MDDNLSLMYDKCVCTCGRKTGMGKKRKGGEEKVKGDQGREWQEM